MTDRQSDPRSDVASNAILRAKKIAEQWAAEKEADGQNARLEARFRDASASSVIAMWDTGRNEYGKLLTSFEREALRIQWYRLFGELPPETKVVVEATTQQTPEPVTDTMLDISEVSRMTGLSLSTIKRKVIDGSFPRHVKLSERRKGWRVETIRQWLSERA